VNLLLVAGIFIAGAFIADARPAWVTRILGDHEEGLRALTWLVAAVCSLPLLIATYRKLQAFGMLFAELRVHKGLSGERRTGVQAILANAMLIAGMLVIGVILLALSSMILQSGRALLLLLGIVGIITAVLWRTFVRIYSKAQLAVQEAFSAAPEHEPRHRTLPSFLEEAELERMEVRPQSVAANKLIRELQLRTVTGASIVAIQRNGKNILNPDPNEELLPGDHLLLIGDTMQLTAAKELLRK
jgi:CPA2 family monovalent cation:H+ antiporter-2